MGNKTTSVQKNEVSKRNVQPTLSERIHKVYSKHPAIDRCIILDLDSGAFGEGLALVVVLKYGFTSLSLSELRNWKGADSLENQQLNQMKELLILKDIPDDHAKLTQCFKKVIETDLAKHAVSTKLAKDIVYFPVRIENMYPSVSGHDCLDCYLSVAAVYCSEVKETVKNVMDAIQKHMQTRYYPAKVQVYSIGFEKYQNSTFFDKSDNYGVTTVRSGKFLCGFEKDDLISYGFVARVRMNHQHKITSNDITCIHMLEQNTLDPLKCPIYHAMRKIYQWNKQNLKHIEEFQHFQEEYIEKPECKYGDECHSYNRLDHDGTRTTDICHMKLFRHPPRFRRTLELPQNIHPMAINTTRIQNCDLYYPTYDDMKQCGYNETNGYINVLIEEVIKNGFESCLGDIKSNKQNKYVLLDIVDEKIRSKRHKSMGSPLDRGQMLALLLYTGCKVNQDLCKCHRDGDYEKWRWFDCCLFEAIYTLSTCETGSFDVFSGLANVKIGKKTIKNGYFVTYVSASWKKDVANLFACENGMVIHIDKSVKNSPNVFCCDVSWISKFEDECEVLFARCVPNRNNPGFQCDVMDDNNGIQNVSLKHNSECYAGGCKWCHTGI